MDLFTPIVPENRWHPNFSAIMKARNGYNCDVLNGWANGFVDRDGKFVKEFQTTFNSSFWELYLNAIFKYYGFSIDWSYSSPDFYINRPIEIIVEAVIALNENDGEPEYLTFESPIPSDLNKFNRKTIIRLSNSIQSKVKKYRESYKSMPHVKDKPFVLSIAAYDRPFFTMTCQRAIEAILFEYYVDEKEYLANINYLEPLIGRQMEKVVKDNDAPVELGLFTKRMAPEVSAIIFSSTATWGKVRALSNDPNPLIRFDTIKYNPHAVTPHRLTQLKQTYRESLLDGLRIYYNPFAENPIDPILFRNKDVFQAYANLVTGEYDYDVRDGLLLFRTVHTSIKGKNG